MPGDDDGLGWRTRVRFAVDAGGRAGLRKHRSHDVVAHRRLPDRRPRGRRRRRAAAPLARRGRRRGRGRAHRRRRGRAARRGRAGRAGPRHPPAAGASGSRPGRTRVARGARCRGCGARARPRLGREEVLVDGEVRGFRVSGAGFWQVHPGAAQALLDAVLARPGPRRGSGRSTCTAGVGLFAAGLAARVGPGGSVRRGRGRAARGRRRPPQPARPAAGCAWSSAGVADALARRRAATPTWWSWTRRARARAGTWSSGCSRCGRGWSRTSRATPRRSPGTSRRRPAPATGSTALRAFDLFPMTHHVECVAPSSTSRVHAPSWGCDIREYLDVEIIVLRAVRQVPRARADAAAGWPTHAATDAVRSDPMETVTGIEQGQLRRQGRRWRWGTTATRSSGWRPSRAPQPLPFSLKVLLENLLRTEDGANITADHIRALAGWDADAEPEHRDPVHAGPGDHAGLHRRAVRRRPRDDARGDGRPRRRPDQDQPARAGRAGHRPLRDRRRLRPRRTRSSATSSSSTSATTSATSSCAGARRAFDDFKVVPPGTGIVPPGQPRVPGPRRDDPRARRACCAPTPTPASAPTRTPRWSTGSACSAGASAASRPRRPCSASRSRC